MIMVMKPWQRPSLAVVPFFLCFLLIFSAGNRTKLATWINKLTSEEDINVTGGFDSPLMEQALVDIGADNVRRDAEELVQHGFPIGPVQYRTMALGLLRDWVDNNRFEPSVMLWLVDQIKAPIDRYNNDDGKSKSGERYSSCAVVGSSGILLNSNNGKLIDGHEFVIRINNAPTSEPFNRHVGSKTSLSFINSNVLDRCTVHDRCYCRAYDGRVATAMYICQPKHFADYAVCKNSSTVPLIVTDPRFDTLCARLVKYYSLKLFLEETGKTVDEWGNFHDRQMFHYSSGMQAVVIALGVCDRVSLFGFGKQEGVHHHYHTRQRAELGLHDYAAEYAFYDDLVGRPEAVPFVNSVQGFRLPKVVVYH